MTRTKKLTLSAMVAAMCVALLAISNAVPRVGLALSALAGILPAAVVIGCGFPWAIAVSVVAGALSLLLLPDKSAALWFCLLFGHYPIWKSLIEQIKSKALSWILKLVGFYACLAALYFLFRAAFTSVFSDALTDKPWLLCLLAVGLGVCFVLYDLAFSRLIMYFQARIYPRMK